MIGTWQRNPVLGRAVLLTGLLVIAGVALGRVDLVLLAAPFVLGTAWSLRRRPQLPPRLEVSIGAAAPPSRSRWRLRAATPARLADQSLIEGGDVVGTVSMINSGPVGYDLVVLRTAASPWLAFPGGDRPHVVAVPSRRAADLTFTGQVRRWGRHQLGPATATVLACGGLLQARSMPAEAAWVKAYPATDPFRASEAMPRAAGLVGTHRSRRPGEGGELAGVRVFTPGDQLRRIDWRVSLRSRQLHVSATLSDRDAEVVLLLDLLADAGRSGGVAGPASVLDTTARAAAAIAEHYLHRGDRVSLVEYGSAARLLRPASGRRQYLTVLEWLLDLAVGSQADKSHEQTFGPQLLSADALIVVLTPLLDERSAQMLAGLARSGRYAVAVDTLPERLPVPDLGQYATVAFRLWQMERENTIAALREHGVPVVPWAGTGSLDQVLRDISRLAIAPKVGVR